jgi:hypothetical protein
VWQIWNNNTFSAHTAYFDTKNLAIWFAVYVLVSQNSHNSTLFSWAVKLLRDILHLFVSLLISVTYNSPLCTYVTTHFDKAALHQGKIQVTSCITLHSPAGFVLGAQHLSWCRKWIFSINCNNNINFGQFKAHHLLKSNLVPPEE